MKKMQHWKYGGGTLTSNYKTIYNSGITNVQNGTIRAFDSNKELKLIDNIRNIKYIWWKFRDDRSEQKK